MRLDELAGKHVVVHTENTKYEFYFERDGIYGLASKQNGSRPRYLAERALVTIHGSKKDYWMPWHTPGNAVEGEIVEGGSLRFSYVGHEEPINTSNILKVEVL